MRPAEDIDKLIKKLRYKASAETHDRVLGNVMRALDEYEKQKTGAAAPHIWRTIMKSPITKIAAAAVIIVVMIEVINYHGGSSGGASIAWGEVLEKIENARTLTWKSTSTWKLTPTEEGKSTVVRYMVLEPYSVRVEWPDGKVKISDYREGKALILDPANKTATIRRTEQTMRNYYSNALLYGGEPISAQKTSHQRIAGKHVVGFNLEAPKEPNGHYGVASDNEPITRYGALVWVDPETRLPVLIEETSVFAEGCTAHTITDEIVFDAELNQSLFSLEVPAGYKLQYDSKMYDRMKSATHMSDILKACMIYDNKHGQLPGSLEKLELPATIDVDKYVYLRPHEEMRSSSIVLHDAYDVWEGGINIGFANGRIQFIEDESVFKEMLERK